MLTSRYVPVVDVTLATAIEEEIDYILGLI